MVHIEYRLEELEPTWQKVVAVATWVFLGLLIPVAAFGYFAEKSVAGQPLYPFKRGIESSILALESLTPYGKTNYLLALADTRVSETSTLIEKAKVSGDYTESLPYSDTTLAEIVTSVKEAEVSIQKISDSNKKKEAEQHLANSIQKYQNNLQKIVVVIHQNNQSSTTLPSIGTSATPTPPAIMTSTPTPTPSQGDTTQPVNTSQDQLTQQIQETQKNLQSIKDGLNVPLDISPTPSLSPTVSPSSPSHKRDNSENNGRDNGKHEDQ